MGEVLHEEGAGVAVLARAVVFPCAVVLSCAVARLRGRACRRGGQVQARPERGKLCH